MAVLKLCLGFYLLLFSLFPVSDGAVTSPQDQEACVGENVTIPWEYDDADADVVSVFWRVNTSTDVMTYFGTTRDPVNGYNVVASNDKGSITITSATRSNSGTYRIDVTATQASSDQVEVLICDAAEASGLKGTKSGSEWKCEASNLGDPEAELYIKVNGKRKSSSSANVARSDKVECCLYGCAVKCMETADDYEYCEVVKRSTTISSTTSTSSNITTPTTATNPPTTTPKNDTTIIIVACVVPFVTLLFIFFIVCYLLRRRRNNNKKQKSNSNLTISNKSSDKGIDLQDIGMTPDTSGRNSGYGEINRL